MTTSSLKIDVNVSIETNHSGSTSNLKLTVSLKLRATTLQSTSMIQPTTSKQKQILVRIIYVNSFVESLTSWAFELYCDHRLYVILLAFVWEEIAGKTSLWKIFDIAKQVIVERRFSLT